MKAARLHAYGARLRLDEVEEPSPTEPHDVVVRIGGAGLCRTDLHIIEGRLRDAVRVELPYVLGHENAGWVHAVGSAVSHVAVGDAVVVHPLATCGFCLACRTGDDMHCSQSSFPGLSADGGFAELLKTNDRALVPLPQGLDPRDVAPLADAGLAAIHAVKRAAGDLRPGATVLVIGAGGLGHLGVQCLKALTPARVIAIDRSAAALQLAREAGADETFGADAGQPAAVRELTGGVQAVLDFVGEDDSIESGLAALDPGGAYYVVGYGGTFGVPAVDLVGSELSIVGNLVGTYPDLVDLIALAAQGKVQVRTTLYPLEAVDDAVADLEGGRLRGRGVLVPER